jgi:hypothetical protein|tara:strand:+ start:192 stop:449 length:258 start_codon:yes stop_codon:yes gene_type:complete
MTIYVNYLTITKVHTEQDYWDKKAKKRVKYKKPKVNKEIVFKGKPHDLTDVIKEVMISVDREYDMGYARGEVVLEVKHDAYKEVY